MTSARYETPPVDAEGYPATTETGQGTRDTSLSDAWMTFRKRKFLILGCAALGACYGFYRGTTQPRLFESSSTIEIRSGSSDEFRVSSNGSGGESTTNLAAQVAILKSDSLLLSVAHDLNLQDDPDFMGSPGPRNIDDPAVRQGVIGIMQGVVTITPVPKTDIIRITCKTLNARLSSDIANKLVYNYIQRSFQSRNEATERVTRFFSHQLDDLKQKVQGSQEQLIDLQKQLGVLGFDPSLNQVTDTLKSLNAAAQAAELARINAETRYRVLAGQDRNLINQPLDVGRVSSAVSSLRSQLEVAQASRAQLSATLGPNNPQMLALDKQIAEFKREINDEQDRVLSDARQAYLAARAQEDQTRGALDAAQAQAFKLRNDLINFTLRQREFESDRGLYEGLLTRLRTAGVEAGLESTEIDIVDPAVPAIAPALRPRSSLIIVNAIIMLVVGLVLAFVLDSLDTNLRSLTEIEEISGLPSLAMIPRTRRNQTDTTISAVARHVGVLSGPKTQFAESFRALRTSLLLSIAGGEPCVILLTSASPAEGKTTVSINLACVLAQRDVRVLLIDADLRRPTVHHRFGVPSAVGLSSVLSGHATFESAVHTLAELPTLDILVSGPVPPFPTELLSSDTMRDLLQHCREKYTHIVIDSPPLLSVTDSVVLARDADAIALVVRFGKSTRQALRHARDLLLRSGARVTGIVLNRVDLNSPEYYSYYGYESYGGYTTDEKVPFWKSSSTRPRSGGDQ
jgi:capsular exopolysaccharide synthesis family protein